MGTSAATPFGGIRVAAFEARMAGPMADLIEKHGGVPVEAPALREIPIADNPKALTCADRLLVGDFDADFHGWEMDPHSGGQSRIFPGAVRCS